MTKPPSPERWAYDISIVLRTVLGAGRLPVDVKEVAREFSKHKFPDDSISMIRGDTLPSFEGALSSGAAGQNGMGYRL